MGRKRRNPCYPSAALTQLRRASHTPSVAGRSAGRVSQRAAKQRPGPPSAWFLRFLGRQIQDVPQRDESLDAERDVVGDTTALREEPDRSREEGYLTSAT